MYKKSKDHLLNLLRQAMTKDSFVQNSAYMFFSSGSAILIQMAFFPILSRIYSPEAYGLFGVINFYTSAVGSSASLSLNQALVLPRERSEFLSLLRLNFLVTFAIVAFVTLLTLACGHTLMVWANTEQMGNWVYLVGPIGLVIAVNRIMVEWTVREKAFRKVTVWSTANSLFNKLFNVGYGKFIDAGATGLVITNVLLYAGQVAACGAFVIRDTWAALRATVPWHEVVSTARKYKNFPRYMFWANTINLVSANIPSVALPALGFALNYVGYFNFALLLLDLPIRMMGSGISSVFLPKAVEMKEERAHELAPATWKLFRMMMLISVLAAGTIFLFGEPLYSLFFGANWKEAGQAAEVLAIYYFFRLLSAPLSVIYNVLKKEAEFFRFQVALFVVRIASLYVGIYFTHDFLELMGIFSLANAVCHLWLCYRIFKMTGIQPVKGMTWTVLVGVIVFGGGYFIKLWLFG